MAQKSNQQSKRMDTPMSEKSRPVRSKKSAGIGLPLEGSGTLRLPAVAIIQSEVESVRKLVNEAGLREQ